MNVHDKRLPLDGSQLENFVLNHVHEWAKDYIEQNQKKSERKLYLSDAIDSALEKFVTDLTDRWQALREDFHKAE